MKNQFSRWHRKRLGILCREIRTFRGISQIDLSRQLKVSPFIINRVEGGTQLIGIKLVAKIIDKLDIDLRDLFQKVTPKTIIKYAKREIKKRFK